MRISSENIIELKDNEIFVFGSNLSGRHGKGAAKQAMSFGAIYGQAVGLQGNTYAIPTVNYTITKPLSIEEIQFFIDDFIQFAKEQSQYKFLVTAIGCGLAYYEPEDIAPLFKNALNIENIYLPERFLKILNGE